MRTLLCLLLLAGTGLADFTPQQVRLVAHALEASRAVEPAPQPSAAEWFTALIGLPNAARKTKVQAALTTYRATQAAVLSAADAENTATKAAAQATLDTLDGLVLP